MVLRRDAAAVQQEVLAAAEAQAEVARQVRDAWKKHKAAERREKVEAFKAELKEKFATLAAKLKKKG